jgi:hypothetical protein
MAAGVVPQHDALLASVLLFVEHTPVSGSTRSTFRALEVAAAACSGVAGSGRNTSSESE